jgi:hypothetical protein
VGRVWPRRKYRGRPFNKSLDCMRDIEDTATARALLAEEAAMRSTESFAACHDAALAKKRERRVVAASSGTSFAIESAYLLGDDRTNEAVIVISVAVEGDSSRVSEVIYKAAAGKGEHAI